MPDVNVRGLDDAVLARLREQAAAEGVSLSEWIRSALADRALDDASAWLNAVLAR